MNIVFQLIYPSFQAMCDSDDDVPQLPADTLAVLHEFYAEQAEQKAKEGEAEGIPEEDWVRRGRFYIDGSG